MALQFISIPLRAVGYREGQRWIAHCLELDVLGQGDTPAEAVREMAELVDFQLRTAIEDGALRSVFFLAPPEYWELFARATAPTKQTRMPKLSRHVERLDYREMACA